MSMCMWVGAGRLALCPRTASVLDHLKLTATRRQGRLTLRHRCANRLLH